jgi:hypothetical protein
MHSEKMAVTDISFRQRAVVEFLVKEGNSSGVIISDFVVCMEMSAWVAAV